MPGVVGPFHSLSESDRRGLVAMVGSGRSVRSAAGELGCHYVGLTPGKWTRRGLAMLL